MNTPPASTLIATVRAFALRTPTAIAVVCPQGRFSWADLAWRAERAAAALHQAGVRRSDRVGLLLANRIEWLELCLGAGALGAVTVPLSTWSTRSELAFLLGDGELKLLTAQARFGDRDFQADLLTLRGSPGFPATLWLLDADGVAISDYAAALAAAPELPGDAQMPEVDAAETDALVLYTSGSTSAPKAVPLRQRALVSNGFHIGARLGLTAADRVLLASPLFWAYGSANALPATWTHGATLVVLEKFDPGTAIEAIEREACTAIYTLPAISSAIGQHPLYSRDRLASLRTGLTIGNPQDFLSQVEVLGAQELCNIYGATETCGNCAVTWHHWPLARRAGCQGPPLPGQEIRFVDAETGAPAPSGTPGLVEVRGFTTTGYQGASAAQNAQAFTADGFYKTGDMGLCNADGDFVFVGRVSEMIKRAGINVSPAEVESVLRRHAAVLDAAVVGTPDAARGERIVAFVVPRNGTRLDPAELLRHCAIEASKYKLPDQIEVCAKLPLTATGKLLRRELQRLAAELGAGRTHTP